MIKCLCHCSHMCHSLPPSHLSIHPCIHPSNHPSSMQSFQFGLSTCRVCVSPAPTCQPEWSRLCLHYHKSCGSFCGSVSGRWRASSSGRWSIWSRRRANSTMRRRRTAVAQRALSIPCWRGSRSLRKVSGCYKNVSQIESQALFFFCLKDLALVSLVISLR